MLKTTVLNKNLSFYKFILIHFFIWWISAASRLCLFFNKNLNIFTFLEFFILLVGRIAYLGIKV